MDSKGSQTAAPPQVSYGARGVNPERLQAIRDHAGRSVLDVGCGSGAYVLELADQYDIHGVDIREFEPWNLRPERFSVHDVCSLPHSPSSTETVVCFEVLEHVPDPGKVIGDLYRICSKNLIL